MNTFRKIIDAQFKPDPGQTHQTEDKRTGAVTVSYSNGRQDQFEKIKRKEFFTWQSEGFPWKYPPAGMTCDPPIHKKTRKERQAEALAEMEQADPAMQGEWGGWRAMLDRIKKAPWNISPAHQSHTNPKESQTFKRIEKYYNSK